MTESNTIFLRGDVNQDGKLSVQDAKVLLDLVYNASYEPACLESADVNNDGKVTVGTPAVDKASVTAEVIESERKDKKLLIFKMKRRKTYRLKKGHRQRHSVVKIIEIKA